jgi:IclR family pca regulon transcriptional regulator
VVRDPSSSDGQFVQSLARGLSVMLVLDSPEPRTVSDVARAAAISRAATRRLLFTLERLGYVRQSAGRFALTPQVLRLGHAYLSGLALPQVVQPHLERLVGSVGESASVAILDGNELVYVARVPVRRLMTEAISVGARFPAHATAMGRVLLADLGPGALAGHDHLVGEVEAIRRRGWALVDGELDPGLRSIAAPIHGRQAVVAAINLSARSATDTVLKMRERLLPPLLETAAAIERDLAVGAGDDRDHKVNSRATAE